MNELVTKTGGDLSSLLPPMASPALQIMLNDNLFERCKEVARYMSKADGMIPRHLIGKPEACFAVVTRAITWKLDPYAVALSTYQTPGGSVGFEGKLCQAILENSGQLEGGVKFEHFGDWSKVQAKFKMATSGKGNQYPVPDWKPEDEAGLGVIVTAQIKNETEPRRHEFLLKQAHPRNSTLWALDPKTQICYTAVRRFANVAVPHLFMGIPFDREDMAYLGPDNARDITPGRPQRSDYAKAEEPAPEPAAEKPEVEHLFDLIDEVGEVKFEAQKPGEFVTDYCRYIAKLNAADAVEAFIEHNAEAVLEIAQNGLVENGASDLAGAQQEARERVAPKEEPEPAQEAASAPEGVAEEPEDSPWLVYCPPNPKRSSNCLGFISGVKAMLEQCEEPQDFRDFLAANEENITNIASRFQIAELKEALYRAKAGAQ